MRSQANNIPLKMHGERDYGFQHSRANANGVKELVIAGLLMASRDIAGSRMGKNTDWQRR